jgi:hypothetical protein
VGIFIKSNATLDIQGRLQLISKGITGDQPTIETQSYLKIMGFPVGNYGPNHNGVDGICGEATRAALELFQIIIGAELSPQNTDCLALKELEQAAMAGSTIRTLALTAFEKGIRPTISIEANWAQFVNMIFYYSIVDEQKSKVPAAVTTTQAILETGYGKFIPVDMATGQFSYNLFGIKGLGPAGSVLTWTREENPKTKVWEPLRVRFRAYSGYLESIEDHSQFFYININRYGGAFRATTPSDFATVIAKAGYATDSNYAGKLIYLMNYWGLS